MCPPSWRRRVAAGLGMAVPAAMPRVLAKPAKPEITVSPALSLTALPGDGGIRTRAIAIAILVADGVDAPSLAAVQAALQAAGATVHLIAPRLGPVQPARGDAFAATATLENAPAVLFDGVVLPDGAAGVKTLGGHVEVMDFIAHQHRHGKTLLAIGAAQALLDSAGAAVLLASGEPDPGVLVCSAAQADVTATDFIAALARHRHPEREAGKRMP